MFFRSSVLALVAITGFTACNVDSDGDGVPAHQDCDDTSAAIGPDAPELCDGLDNNCNGIVDDDTTDAPTFYADFDGDGFGDPDTTTTDCRFSEATGGPDPDFEPFGFVRNADDCDDALRTVNPDADERCDGIDNNCDEDIDGTDAVDPATWYADTDGDGFGDENVTSVACDEPDGYVADSTDCNDSSDVSNPGAEEICDSDDNDCDGETDEDDAVDAESWFADTDEDTFGDPNNGVFACAQPDGYVADMTDCDDEAATANPDGVEVCDGLDNDCDETTLEDGTVSLNATADVYSTIQEAVNAAAEGDTVYVCAGEWSEQVVVRQAITLRSGTGPDTTTINGGATEDAPGSVIFVEVPETTAVTRIEGFTITGGFATASTDAGGIEAIGSEGDIEVADCVITDNSGYVGGFLAPIEANASVTDSEFTNNVATVGGGLVVFNGEILDSRVLDNEAEVIAGGVYVGGTVDLTGTRVISNYAGLAGGGLYAEDSEAGAPEITGGTYLNNLSDEIGGGMYVGEGSIIDAVINNNRATDRAGGIYLGDGEIENTSLDGNSAPEGGGIYLDGDALLIDVDITSNTASATGGGVYQSGGDVLIENCAIEGNTATAGGGWHLVSGTLDVSTSDWGTAADSNDNDPDDLYSDASATAYDAFGTGETFSCDSDGSCI